MPVVDASVLVPAFDADHPLHGRARKLLAAAGRVAIHPGTLAELSTVLRRQANLKGLDGANVARNAVRALRSLPGMRDTGDNLAVAATRRYLESKELSFVDAWTIEAALADRDELLSLDRAQVAAWKTAQS